MNCPFSPGSRVVAYLRDSGHEDQEMSVEQQAAALTAWAAANSLVIETIYQDVAAGSNAQGRTAFQDMISYFRSDRCTAAGLVIWKYSRFARNIDDAQYYRADLRRRGYIVHSLNDTVPQGLDGRFFEAAVDWMNARYLDDLRTDIRRGQRHILNQHGALGGKPPVGFRRESIEIGNRRDGRPHIVARWVPDPDTWDRCQLAWHMRAEGASYTQIHAACNLFKSRAGYKHFFENRLYIGELEFGGEIITGYCDPMVDISIWQAVQAVNNRAISGPVNNNHPRRANSAFALSGLAHCARCGSSINGEWHKSKGNWYGYYICGGTDRYICNLPKIPAAQLEEIVIGALTDYILSPDQLAARQAQLNQTSNTDLAIKRDVLQARLTECKRKSDNLVEAIADGGGKALVQKLSDIELEIDHLQAELHALTIQLAMPVPAIDPAALAAQAAGLLESKKPAEIRRVMVGVIDRIIVERDTKNVSGVIWFYHPPEFVSMSECPRRGANYRHKQYGVFEFEYKIKK